MVVSGNNVAGGNAFRCMKGLRLAVASKATREI